MTDKIDIPAFERKIRAQIAADIERAKESIASGKTDEAFFRAQNRYDETQVQFSIASATSGNEDERRHAIAAAGIAIGSMLASASFGLTPREQQTLIQWVLKTHRESQTINEDGALGSVVDAPYQGDDQ